MKNKVTSKIVSWLLMFAMIFTATPISAFAEDAILAEQPTVVAAEGEAAPEIVADEADEGEIMPLAAATDADFTLLAGDTKLELTETADSESGGDMFTPYYNYYYKAIMPSGTSTVTLNRVAELTVKKDDAAKTVIAEAGTGNVELATADYPNEQARFIIEKKTSFRLQGVPATSTSSYYVYFEVGSGNTPDVPDVPKDSFAITDAHFNANQTYDTFYYTADAAYTYNGKPVEFTSETQVTVAGETKNLKNKRTEVTISTNEDGETVVSLSNLVVPVSQIPGQWNSSFGGVVQMVYKTDIADKAEIRSAESTNAPTTINLGVLSDGTYHLTGGTIYEKANEWSGGADFGDGKGTVKERFFGTLPDITVKVGGTETPDPDTPDVPDIPDVPNVPKDSFAITDAHFNANQTYDTFYYTADAAYTYNGKPVEFTSETQVTVDGETKNLKNKQTEVTISTNEAGETVVSLSNLAVPVSQIPSKWNSTSGGVVQMVYKTDIADKEEVRSASSTKAPTTINLGVLSAGTYHLTGGTIYEKANQWSPGTDFGDGKGTVKERFFGTLPDITVKISGPIEPMGYLGVKTEAKVYDDFENDIWLQAQQKPLNVGDTASMYPRRVPQIVSDVIGNDVQRPMFHFEIIYGDSVTLDNPDTKDSLKVTAVKPGTTVVKATYDAVDYKGTHWGETSPVNTGYLVYTVGETGKVQPTVSDNLFNWRHYDTIYYNEGETVPYSFTATANGAKSIEVTLNGQPIEGENGKYTAQLENRSNIIGIVATDNDGNTQSVYRVVDARFIEVNVQNKTNEGDLKGGDTATVSFRGITMPVYKLATIYNPQFGKNSARVIYTNEKLGTFEGACGQWDLATKNSFDVPLPADAEGDYLFHSDRGIYLGWWANVPLGSDLDLTVPGKPVFDATTSTGDFCTLPDFTIKVGKATPVSEVKLNKTAAALKLGETEQLTAEVLPADATHKNISWVSEDDNVVTVSADGLLTAVGSGSTVVKATADGVTAECRVSVSAVKPEEVNAAIAVIPDEAKVTLWNKEVVEYARWLYNNMQEADQSKVTDIERLTKAEEAINTLMSTPFLFTADGKQLPMVNTGKENAYRGHYYKVTIPENTQTVQLHRFKDFSVLNSSWGSLYPSASSTLDIAASNYMSEGNYFVLNTNQFVYEYVYFEVGDVPDDSVVTVDKTALQQVIAKAEELKQSSYTAASWAAVAAALQTAKTVADDEAATQVQVLKAANALNEAIAGLKTSGGNQGGDNNTIKVTFYLLGDVVHDKDANGKGDMNANGGPHTMADDNLEGWFLEEDYEVARNSTVKDVLLALLEKHNMSARITHGGNYVAGITRGDVELAEFTNGSLSGWMYTLDDVYPNLGVAQQRLTKDCTIVFHYTDDYTKERGSQQWNGGSSGGGGGGGGTTATTKPTDPTTGADNKTGFVDVKTGDWFYDAVKYAKDNGLMNGEENNRFNPNSKLNRAMLVTILYRLEKEPNADAGSFVDVAAGQWYAKAVAWASANGIVKGYEDGNFRPLANISREEFAAVLMRYVEFKKVDVTKTADLSGYKDAAKVSAWAKDNLAWANAAGLIKGDDNNNLNPQGAATRAEAATILMRLSQDVLK